MASRNYQALSTTTPFEGVDELFLSLLKPGDMLVYSSDGFFGKAIKFKTASEFTHVAVYIGNGEQREFKEGKGAQQVPFRSLNLVAIKRPYGKWDKEKSDQLWEEVKTQTYDYVGLFWSFYARKVGRHNNAMFCSEYYARDYAVSVGEPMLFSEDVDADSVTPGNCYQSPSCWRVWPARK